MRVADIVAAQTEALMRLMPPFDAIGIGGSFGRGAADPNSDVDFFVFLERDDFWPQAAAFPSVITHPLPVVSEGIGRFMSDYGYVYAYLLEGGFKVEYYLNAPETMTQLPLSARIEVLADRSGYLTAYLARAREVHARDVGAHVAAGVHDCLVHMHDLRKLGARGDLLPMVWQMDRLRRPVLALDHMRRSADVYAPSSAASRLAERTSRDHAQRVMETVPGPDRASLGRAYAGLRSILLEAWGHFVPLGVPTAAQLELERMFSEAILRSLGDESRAAGADP